jgi:transcriptional regulator with XRE-family HTH domain
MDTIIGHNIKRLMAKHRVRQVDIVARTGMCKSHLSEIMNGHTTHPSVWTCVRIAEAIGCSLDELVGIPVVKDCLTTADRTIVQEITTSSMG